MPGQWVFRYDYTGCMGAGKSLVAQLLKAQGAHIIDADKIGKGIVQPGTEGLKRIAALFGGSVFDEQGRLDTTALATAMFGNKQNLEAVNTALHPLIRKMYVQELYHETNLSGSGVRLVVWDVPLLYECEQRHAELESVIAVLAPRDLCIERLVHKRSLEREDACRRFDSQMSPKEKERRADVVIRNDGDIATLEREVEMLYEKTYREVLDSAGSPES